MIESKNLEIKRIRAEARLPFYANHGDAGLDISAAEEIIIYPGETKTVATGLILNIPYGYEVQIRPRSGLSLKTRLRLPNAPGTIDSGYKDELKILIHNASPDCSSDTEIYDLSCKSNPAAAYKINVGDRIAQMVFAKVSSATIVEVDEFSSEDVPNRGGGFGSSGVKL